MGFEHFGEVIFGYIMPCNPLANVVRLLPDRSDTKSNVKLDIRSRVQASYVTSHTEEL